MYFVECFFSSLWQMAVICSQNVDGRIEEILPQLIAIVFFNIPGGFSRKNSEASTVLSR